MIEVLKINPREIIIPENRIRQNIGDINELARQIKTIGQIQPIIIDDNNTLIAGYRRLMACRNLDIDVLAIRASNIALDVKTHGGRRKIELIENIGRKQLEWKEEIIAIDEFHQTMSKEKGQRISGRGAHSGGWALIDTAQVLGLKSHAQISKACKIARYLREKPELFENIKNISGASSKIQKIERGHNNDYSPLPHSIRYIYLEKQTEVFYKNKLKLHNFNSEDEFDSFIYKNRNIIFGERTHFINIKTLLSSK